MRQPKVLEHMKSFGINDALAFTHGVIYLKALTLSITANYKDSNDEKRAISDQ